MRVLAGKMPVLFLPGFMAAPAFGALPECSVAAMREVSFESDALSRLGSPATTDVP